MGLSFMMQKSWHPANKANQRRLWIAEEESKDRERREKEFMRERDQELEYWKNRNILEGRKTEAQKKEELKHAVDFLYQPPPGLRAALDREAQERRDKEEQERQEAEDKALAALNPLLTGGEPSTGSDAGGATPPPPAAAEKEKEKGKEPPKKLKMEEKFSILKNAPVEGKYTESVQVRHRPFGVELRNVKCLRCGEWGHQSGDRECKLRDANPNDSFRHRIEDPLYLIQEREKASDLRVEVKGAGSHGNIPSYAPNQQMVEDYAPAATTSDDPLAGLSEKERKKLLKRYEKLKRKMEKKDKKKKKEKKSKKHDSSDDDSSSSSDSEDEKKASGSKRRRGEESTKSSRRSRSRSRSPRRGGEKERERDDEGAKRRCHDSDDEREDRRRDRDRHSKPTSSSSSSHREKERERERERDRSPRRSSPDRRRRRSRS